MDKELQEAIGRTLYEESFLFDDDDMPTWDELSEDTWIKKSTWIARAEKVIETYNQYRLRQMNSWQEIAGTDVRWNVHNNAVETDKKGKNER